ncbi:MAG TPA: ATP-binding protein [Archangium sp.]|uniref:ATP-binding protein n=1 Tax=Archangium sp. TaxID=1872627 RepID=UPI002E33AE60|nr:ATP-binding protein [Archangium sp.]HEX5745474.1 ATP-binding protein [Archangium sp.]
MPSPALLLVVGLGVALTGALLVFAQRALHGQEQEALAQQTARAHELASELDEQLRAAERQAIEDLLRRMLASAPEQVVYGRGVWFEPGQFASGVRYMDPYVHQRQVLTYQWSTPAYDYPHQDWYQQAWKRGERIAISEPYFDPDHTYVSLTRAFFDDQGRQRGIVSVDLILPMIGEVVRQANDSPAETLYLVSTRGALIAQPCGKVLLAWARRRGRSPRSLAELTLEDLRTWEHEQGLDRGWRTTEVNVRDAGWRVFASTKKDMLFSDVRHQRWLLVALGVLPPKGVEGQELAFDTLPLPRALRGGAGGRHPRLHPAPLNRRRVLRVNAAPIRDESGQVVAAVSVGRDITQAIELERLQGEFVKMAAHELKTPLAVMKSFAQLACRTAHPGPALRRALEGISRGVDRMDRVVRTLLDASQLQLGRLHFEKTELRLRALVEAAAASTAAHHPRHPIHVRPGPDAWVLGDRARLEQVLTELMDNAARYSPAGTPVEVSLRMEGGEVEISIRDEGIGISEEQRERLFESFYRAQAGTPHDRGGMGLGLYLSRGILLLHEGRVELESQEGEGTHVRVRLPRLPEQQPAPEMASHQEPAYAAEHGLVRPAPRWSGIRAAVPYRGASHAPLLPRSSREDPRRGSGGHGARPRGALPGTVAHGDGGDPAPRGDDRSQGARATQAAHPPGGGGRGAARLGRVPGLGGPSALHLGGHGGGPGRRRGLARGRPGEGRARPRG